MSGLVTHVVPVALCIVVVAMALAVFAAQAAITLDARGRRRAHVGHRTLRGDLTALAAWAGRLVRRPDPLEQHLQRCSRRSLAQVGGPR